MTIRLLDVNLLFALTWPDHQWHALSQDWFAGVRAAGWATCPLTELGTIRILANPAITRGRISVSTATERLRSILDEPDHRFWAADIDTAHPPVVEAFARATGHNQITDFYLLALAAANDGVLATLDHGIAVGLPAGSPLLRHMEVVAA